MASLPGPDLAFQAVNGEVDLRELRRGLVLLVAVEGDALHRVLTSVLDEVTGLNEHAARAARGVEDDAVIRLDHVDDGLHDGRRREELAVVVRALLGELGEEVLVDAPEHIARRLAQGLGVERAHHAVEKFVVEPLVVLGKLTGQRLEAGFDRLHGLCQRRAHALVLRRLDDFVEARGLGQHQRPTLGEVASNGLAVRHLSGLLVGLDGGQRFVVAVGCLPQE